MVPRPGDPPKARASLAGHLADEAMERENDAAIFSQVLINLQEGEFQMDNKLVQNAVLFWKSKADRLRLSGVSLFVNRRNARNIDPLLLAEAYQLDNFLDELITKESVETTALFAKLRLLVTGGESSDAFHQQMKSLDYSLKCNVIWENDSVAYRCNTCALTPCMSLCAECFLANGHKNHDFTRFFSREGGACDCGNADVLYESGFCHRHGENAKKPEGPTPRVSLAEYIYMKLLVHFFLQLRGFNKRLNELSETSPPDTLDIQDFCESHQQRYRHIISFLQECVNIGGPMRDAMSNVLVDDSLYEALTEEDSSDALDTVDSRAKAQVSLDWRTRTLFEEDLMSLQNERCKEFFEGSDSAEFLRCSNLLHELIVWIFRLNFPQNVINFSLSMLSEPLYLDALSKRFFKWYPVVANCMRSLCLQSNNNSRNEVISQAGSRIIHISVQMLSSSVLCAKLDREIGLVKTVFQSSLFLLTETTSETEICLAPIAKFCLDSETSLGFRHPDFPWHVITLENNLIIGQHGYWFVMGDVQNVMSHVDVAVLTLRQDAFNKTYMKLVSCMQGMSGHWRIISGDHQMHDNPETAHRSFTLEYETLAITMFNFVSAVLSKSDAIGACLFFDSTVKALEQWLAAVCGPECGDVRSCPAYHVTYHIPLHRHVSTALSHFERFPLFQTHTQDFLKNEALLRRVLLHPMRIQVARAEYQAQMWVRNGNQMRMQSIIYAQPHINMSFLTPDLDLIRYCAANVDPDWFICSVFESFHLDDVFQIQPFVDQKDSEMTDVTNGDEQDQTQKENPLLRLIKTYLAEYHQQEAAASSSETAPEQSMDTAEAPEEQEKTGEAVGEPSTSQNTDETAKTRITDMLTTSLREAGGIYISENQISAMVKRLKPGSTARRVFLGLDEARKRTACEGGDSEAFYAADSNTTKLGAKIGICWKEDESTKVLLRPEWFDHMIHGALLMLAELTVVRVNSGMTDEEALRTEMVHELNVGSLTFSGLRSYMGEKGSRGGSAVDVHFEKILGKIADFHAPDQARSGKMEQGTFSLKQEVWSTDFCPVMCQMRAPMPAKSHEILRKVEEMDKASLPPEQRPNTHLWIPYRLYPLDLNRFGCVSSIPRILLTDRFIQLSLLTLMYRRGVKETTIQLVIYLLTVGAQWAAKLSPPQKKRVFKRFYTTYPVSLQKTDSVEVRKFSLFYQIYGWFLKEAEKKGKKTEIIGKVLNGELKKERIIGGPLEYLGRLLSVLAENHNLTHILLSADKRNYSDLETNTPSQELSEIEAKKLAAKKRREALMAQVQKKQQTLMKKHMAKEGLTQSEVDGMDISNRKVRLYECPMCGVESPSTVNAPMGMLVKLSTNCISNMRMSSDFEQPTLFVAAEEKPEFSMPKRSWDHFMDKDIHDFQLGVYKDLVLGPQMATEIKTCGHTAHIDCFHKYKESLRQHELRGVDASRFPVPCPLCRMMIDCLIPMRFDADVAIETSGSLDNSQRIFGSIRNSIVNHQKVYDDAQEMLFFSDHYNKYTDEWMSRINPADQESMKTHDRQTNIAAIVRVTVERNVLLSELEIPERRREGQRSVVIEHLIPSIVYHTTKRSEEICLAAARDLFVPEMIQRTPSTSSIAGTETGGGEADTETGGGDTEKTNSLDIEEDSVMDILASTPQQPTLLLQQTKVEQLLADRSTVPLLMLDLRLLFIRLSSFIIDSDKITPTEQKALLCALTARLLKAAAIKCAVLLMYRVTPELAKDFAAGNVGDSRELDAIRIVGKWYQSRESMFSSLLSHLSDDEYSIKEKEKVFVTLRMYVSDLEKFYREFIYSTGLFERSEQLAIPDENFSQLSPCVENWLQFYTVFLCYSPDTSTSVIHRIPLIWRVRTLLYPPQHYDDLFSKFFRKKCLNCDSVPSLPLMCMLCGCLLCLDECCSIRTYNRVTSEVEKHAEFCTGTACVFLALNNAVVVVTNGSAGAIWGSVYLDAHGEEDRNLRRGKPLFLAEKRMKNLLCDWAEQEWTRALPFVQLLPGLVAQLKDAHQYYR